MIRDPDILLLNLGADRQFKQAHQMVSGLVASYAFTTNHASFESKTSRSLFTVSRLLLDRIGLLHVMAHGDPRGRLYAGYSPWRPHKAYDVRVTRQWVSDYGVRLNIDAVLLDACDTYTDEWQEHLGALLPAGRSGVMIGTTRSLGWDEAGTYVSAFYSSLLRRPFPATPARRRANVLNAHDRANAAYKTLLGRKSPYDAIIIHG